jgi:hypothetical protein
MITMVIAAMLASPAPGAERPAADPNRRVCRTRTVTGSRTDFERICMTVREWNERRAANHRLMRETTDRGTTLSRDALSGE